MTIVRKTLGLLFCIMLSGELFAQSTNDSMRFTLHDPCGGGNANSCATVIVGQGVFDETTLSKFRKVIDQHRRLYKIDPPGTSISAVIFSSPGGSLAAGIALGREIRQLKIDTRAVSDFNEYIPKKLSDYVDYVARPVLRNAKCLSACAYAFLGGSRRSVEKDNILGIHQFRSTVVNGTLESDAQTTTAQLSLYAESMGVSPKFLTLASLTPSNEITYIGVHLAQTLKVDNVHIALSEWNVGVTNNGTPFLTNNQAIDESHSARFTMFLNGQNVFIETSTVLNIAETRSDRLNLFPLNETPAVSIFIDGAEYKGVAVGAWRKTTSRDALVYSSISTFPRNVLLLMQRAKSLSISDNFAHALSDLSLETELSTSGLNSGISLLIRTK